MDEPAVNAESKALAESAANTYRQLGGQLIPVIGSRGYRVLFARAVHITRRDYSWLSNIAEAEQTEISYEELTASLQSQRVDESRRAHHALVTTLADMLNRMIGEELTRRLLRIVADVPPPRTKEDQE